MLQKMKLVACLMTAFTLFGGTLRGQDPFWDPCDVDVDWFAPIACGCPDDLEQNTGWYFSYARLKAFVSRPDEAPGVANLVVPLNQLISPISSASLSGAQFVSLNGNENIMNDTSNSFDGAWGNRYDLGFQDNRGGGYHVGFLNINNPREVVTEDHQDLDGDAALDFFADPLTPTFVTQNAFNVYGMEVNRMFGTSVSPRGTLFQPLVGVRYIRFRDHADRLDYFRDNTFIQGLPGFPVFTAGANIPFDTFEFFQNQEITTDNDLLGGQFGLHSQYRHGRWVISTTAKGIAMNNFRSRERHVSVTGNVDTVNAIYGADATDGIIGNGQGALLQVVRAVNSGDEQRLPGLQTVSTDHSNNFAYGGDFHLDTTFYVTKGFALNAGGQILWIADGIGRGVVSEDEDLIIGGLNFGLSWNR